MPPALTAPTSLPAPADRASQVVTIHVTDVAHGSAAYPPDRATVVAALKSLPPLHRDLIRRAHFDRCTTAEIADDLRLPESVVKCELHCALRDLLRLVRSRAA